MTLPKHAPASHPPIPARKIANVYMVDAKAVELFGVVVRAREALAAYTGKPAE